MTVIDPQDDKINRPISKIDFDVAITVGSTDNIEAGGKVGIQIFSAKLGGNNENHTENVSRITFSIPVVLPNTHVKNMAEWNEKSLGEIAEVTKLAGFEFTKYIKYDDDGEIIALRALNLRNGELDLSDIKRISRKVSEGLTRSKIYKDDILLAYTGNGYGDCAIIEENDKYHLAPNICKIVPNQDVVFPYYLYCYIRSKAFYNQMSNNMTGSGQPTIPMKTI